MSDLDSCLDGNLSQEGDPLKAVLLYYFIYTLTGQREDDSVKSGCTYSTIQSQTHNTHLSIM